jgi:hypothetical protein
LRARSQFIHSAPLRAMMAAQDLTPQSMDMTTRINGAG